MRFRQFWLSVLAAAAIVTPLQARDQVARTPLALETFDEVWRILNETHFDTNFNGHNWNEMREKYRPKAAAARNSDALRDVLQEMIDLLAVSHLAIVPGDFVAELEDTEDENTAADEGGASLERADEDESGTLGMQLRYVGKESACHPRRARSARGGCRREAGLGIGANWFYDDGGPETKDAEEARCTAARFPRVARGCEQTLGRAPHKSYIAVPRSSKPPCFITAGAFSCSRRTDPVWNAAGAVRSS